MRDCRVLGRWGGFVRDYVIVECERSGPMRDYVILDC